MLNIYELKIKRLHDSRDASLNQMYNFIAEYNGQEGIELIESNVTDKRYNELIYAFAMKDKDHGCITAMVVEDEEGNIVDLLYTLDGYSFRWDDIHWEYMKGGK